MGLGVKQTTLLIVPPLSSMEGWSFGLERRRVVCDIGNVVGCLLSDSAYSLDRRTRGGLVYCCHFAIIISERRQPGAPRGALSLSRGVPDHGFWWRR